MFSQRIYSFMKFQKLLLSDLQKPFSYNQYTSKCLMRTTSAVNEEHKIQDAQNEQNQKNSITNTTPRNNFKVFYRFQHITSVRLFARLKIIQTGITVLLIPWTFYLQNQGLVESPSVFYSISISSFAAIMLFTISQFCQRFIGLAAINPPMDTVRLSHLTFWGQRNDVFVSLEDLIPPTDIGEDSSDLFFKVKM